MNYIYHYCLLHQKDLGMLAYPNGIVETSIPIRSPESYETMIQNICNKAGVERDKTIVLSLNLIGGASFPTSEKQP